MSDPVTPSMPKQAAVTTTSAAVNTGGASAGFALILFLALNRFDVFGPSLGATEAVLIQGAFSVMLQTVFAVVWSLFKQYLEKHGYTV